MRSRKTIAPIIRAGLIWLCLAHAFVRDGFNVAVFERDREPEVRGQTYGPYAARAALDKERSAGTPAIHYSRLLRFIHRKQTDRRLSAQFQSFRNAARLTWRPRGRARAPGCRKTEPPAASRPSGLPSLAHFPFRSERAFARGCRFENSCAASFLRHQRPAAVATPGWRGRGSHRQTHCRSNILAASRSRLLSPQPATRLAI